MYIIIHLQIPILSINACLYLQVCSIGCCSLQNGWQLHYHTVDRVLTSGCSFISQQIWNKIFITLEILGIYIKIEALMVGQRSIYIHISRWHTIYLESVTSQIDIAWRQCRSWQRGHRIWSWLSALIWLRYTCFFAPPIHLQILHCGILARKAAVYLIFTNHSLMSIYCCLHISVPGNFNSLYLLFSKFEVRCLDLVLRFRYCSVQNPAFCHFGHVQSKAYEGLC